MNEQERPNGLYTRQTAFGNMLFTREEHSAIQAALRQRLGREFISQRPGPGNQKLTYIEGHKAVALANELFGYDGWSTFVLWTTINFVDEKAGRYNVGVHSCVRVMLKNGASQEDLGFGAADNARSKTAALEKALKESVTDANSEEKANRQQLISYSSTRTVQTKLNWNQARTISQSYGIIFLN